MESHRDSFKRKVVTSIIFTLGIVLMLTAIPVVGAFAQETVAETPMTDNEAEVAKWLSSGMTPV